MKRERSDDPPELTRRRSGSGGLIYNAAVDLEWLGSLAEEFNVVCESGGSGGEDDEEEGEKGVREIEQGGEGGGGEGGSKGEQRDVQKVGHSISVCRRVAPTGVRTPPQPQ